MTLTEYEMADLAMSAQASATPTTALFISVLSGYLIIAWLVGKRLTRAQVVFINVLFIFFQLSLVGGWASRWALSYRYSSALNSIDPSFYEVSNPVFLWAFPIAMIASVPGSLKFMWDVRHPKAE
jgi:hypothetical protein